MPLYSNILSKRGEQPKDSTDNKTTPSNAGLKFLQDHLKSKKRNQQQHQPAKVPRLGDLNEVAKNQIISKRDLHASEFEWNLEEEYDPRVPNSYEILVAEYIKDNERNLKQQNDRKKQQQQQQHVTPNTNKIDLSLLEALDQFEEDNNCDTVDGLRKGTAIAPPTNLSTSTSSVAISPPISAGPPKTSASLAPVPPKVGPTLPKSPVIQTSRVLLLQNMVGPGEVDDSLEDETKEECGKYGIVNKCLIYEFPAKSVPEEEAVRIFVEFSLVESAERAAKDLDGRFFGGRIVRATFYDLDKFNKYELGQPVRLNKP